MAVETSLYRMADRMVGGDLEAILKALRASGESFGGIAKRLYADHGIDVTGQTVANWLGVIACECPEPDVDGIGQCRICKRKPAELLRRPAS